MRKYIDVALKILNKIFDEGSYSNRALSSDKTSDMTTKLVYGVLERNIEIEWVLSCLVKKQPKGIVLTLLKIGTYALLHASRSRQVLPLQPQNRQGHSHRTCRTCLTDQNAR